MKKWKRTLNLIIGYLRWNISSWRFVIAVLTYTLLLFLSVYDDYRVGSDAGVFYFLQLAYVSKYQAIAPMLCALPAAMNLCREFQYGSFYFIYTRAGKAPYPLAMGISTFITAFLAASASSVIFLGLIAARCPLIGGNAYALQSCIETVSNGGLIMQGYYLWFYFVTIAGKACFMGMMACITAFVSEFLIDPVLSLVSPMVIYVIICDVMIRLGVPGLLNPSYVFNSTNYNIRFLQQNVNQNFSIVSCMYPFIYAFTCSIIFTLLMYVSLGKMLERRSER